MFTRLTRVDNFVVIFVGTNFREIDQDSQMSGNLLLAKTDSIKVVFSSIFPSIFFFLHKVDSSHIRTWFSLIFNRMFEMICLNLTIVYILRKYYYNVFRHLISTVR